MQAKSTTMNKKAADKTTLLAAGKRTITMEVAAVNELLSRIDEHFVHACELILAGKGRVIVLGIGKSGHIARKIAATLASTGTPSFFVHPSEASHGDFGMITSDDLVIAISNSGKAPEIIPLLPLLKRKDVPIIAMTGKKDSALATVADVVLDTSVELEACPLDLAPTSSTTTTLVMGDALAMALLEARGFTQEEFAFAHPGGTLGKRLLTKVEDIMHSGDALPTVPLGTSLKQALVHVSEKGLGMTTVVDSNQTLQGVFTDGDLRRSLDKEIDINHTATEAVMTTNPTTMALGSMAVDALNTMEAKSITALVIVDEDNHPVGVIHMHDILKAGLV